MRDDLDRVSEALGVPTRWLLGLLAVAFTILVAAAVTHDAAVERIAAAVGVLMSLIGLRAAMRPSRPFHLENLTNSPGIDTTRRVGLFYVVVGLTWTALVLAAAASA